MKWKQWKLGLFIACVIGFFTACTAASVLDVKLNLKFYFFFLSLIGKDVILYLTDHKAETVSFDTTTITKTTQITNEKTTVPPTVPPIGR